MGEGRMDGSPTDEFSHGVSVIVHEADSYNHQ